MMMRSPATVPFLLVLAACDPSYAVVVTRPVGIPVDRACASQVLAAESTFTARDTVARARSAPTDSALIGMFRWRVGAASYATEPYARFLDENGGLAATIHHRSGRGVDTLVAATGRLGRPGPQEVLRASGELAGRLDAVTARCATPIAPARCVYRESGRSPVACEAAP